MDSVDACSYRLGIEYDRTATAGREAVTFARVRRGDLDGAAAVGLNLPRFQ
jgi:hypothetical protein